MDVLYSTNPHWIRCVKPHPSKRPRQFHGVEVMSQLKSAGVLETIRIRQMSFLVRFTFADFVKHFRVIAPASAPTAAQAAGAIIAAVGLSQEVAQVGRTKVFLKVEGFQAIARARDAAWARSAVAVQRVLRARIAQAAAARHRVDWYARIAQASIAALQSSRHMRRVQLAAEEQRLITLFRGVLILQIDEDAVRQQFIAHVDAFTADAQRQARALAVAAHQEQLEKVLRACVAEERRAREALAARLWATSAWLEESFRCATAESQRRLQIVCEEHNYAATLSASHGRLQTLCAEWFEFVRQQERLSVEEVEAEYRCLIDATALGELAVLHASSDVVMEEAVFRIDVSDEADSERVAVRLLYIGSSIALLLQEVRRFRSSCKFEEEQRFIALAIEEVRARDNAVQATWMREREDAIRRIEQRVAVRRGHRG
jgi:myosin heavy subunit